MSGVGQASLDTLYIDPKVRHTSELAVVEINDIGVSTLKLFDTGRDSVVIYRHEICAGFI